VKAVNRLGLFLLIALIFSSCATTRRPNIPVIRDQQEGGSKALTIVEERVTTGPSKQTRGDTSTGQPNMELGKTASAEVSRGEISATLYSSESQHAVYLEGVNKAITRNWSYPDKAKQNKEEGRVVLIFTILQDGSLEDIRIQHSSGFTSLDKAAIGTIVSAIPFEPIPKQIGLEKMEITFTFQYKLTESSVTLKEKIATPPQTQPVESKATIQDRIVKPPQTQLVEAKSPRQEETSTETPDIERIVDDKVQAFVNNEAMTILSVSRNADRKDFYKFLLGNFENSYEVYGPEFFGLKYSRSVGHHVIYINYDLARTALTNALKKTRLRIELAHQIAHDNAGHNIIEQLRKIYVNKYVMGTLVSAGFIGLGVITIPFQAINDAYGSNLLHEWRNMETEADRLGIEYWKLIGWECMPWVRLHEEPIENWLSKGNEYIPPDLERKLREIGDFCLSTSGRKYLEVKFQQWGKQIEKIVERNEKENEEWETRGQSG